MVSVISEARIKMGRLIKVWNTKRSKFSNSKRTYIALQVEDSDGGNERCLLFTENEIKMAEYRASRNVEDLTDKDFLSDILD